MKMLFAFVFLVFPLPVFAQPVLINEIAWMGGPVEGVEEKQWWRYEWLELYNATDTVGMLDGWMLELYREKLDFTVSLKDTIVPNGYYVAGASDKIPNLDLNYKNLGGKFFNGGQRVILKNSLGEIIDEVDTRSGWPTGDNKTKQTMERIEDASQAEALAKAWQTSAEPGGTPKAPNSAGTGSTLASLSYPHLSEAKEEIEKDLVGSFQGRVPVINPITILAGLLALGFSGVLLVLKRSLALRQRSGQASRPASPKLQRGEQERQQS